MEHRARSVFVRAQAVLVLVLMVASAWAASRHNLSFTYSVTQESESGPLVHIALHVQLTNRGNDPVSIQRLTLRHVASLGQSKPFSPITVQAHSSSHMTQELTLSRLEFEHWKKDMGPKILLEVQSDGSPFRERVHPDKLSLEK